MRKVLAGNCRRIEILNYPKCKKMDARIRSLEEIFRSGNSRGNSLIKLAKRPRCSSEVGEAHIHTPVLQGSQISVDPGWVLGYSMVGHDASK